MLNPFFLQGSKTEQGLVQDLINEQLRMYGIDVFYLPRKYVTEKTVLKEVIESVFDNAYPLEAYLDNFEGYSDNATILSKFGIQQTQELNLIISRERFHNYIEPLIKNQPNTKLTTRPKEGDLIYFPLGDRLFEIKFVEHEKPFYQLQGSYTYGLKCELFRYEDEVIDTSVSEIDDLLVGNNLGGQTEDGLSTVVGNIQTLTLVGAGITATASCGIITSGGIRFITVSNRGGGYTSVPRVAISSAPSGGLTGIATAGMISGIVVCNDNLNPSSQSVQRVDIINPGFGYTVAPRIRFIGGGGKGATATATLGNGLIGAINITNVGSGYTAPPTISFVNEVFLTGVSTQSAQAISILNNLGQITEIRIVNAGLGYSTAPTIRISSPSLTSVGNFKFNEIVTGSVSGITARVRTWNSLTNILEVASITGQFLIGENIVGSESGASRQLRLVNTDPRSENFANNEEIQTEANKIIDFDESNPFGTV